MKILIVIPYYQNVSDATKECINVIMHLSYKIDLHYVKGCYVAFQRNIGISQEKSLYEDITGFDIIVQIDSDIIFTERQFIDMINKTKKYKVISGLYEKRGKPEYSTACTGDIKNDNKCFLQMDSIGIKKIDSSGAGFLFIDASILKNIQKPWFERIKYINDNTYYVTGEDEGFFIKAKEAGYQGYIDCDCKVINNCKVNNINPIK